MSSDVRRRHQNRRTTDAVDREPLVEEARRTPSPLELRGIHWKTTVLVLFLIVVSSVHLHKCLPEPLSPNEENTRFSELRAARILNELSSYGAKPAGSEACERKTRGRIIKELNEIKSTAASSVKFEVATQNPSGCFDIPKFDTDGLTICYRNVSNVIARLGKNDDKERISVLLNCHYDSWPTGSGGSDDLISCALMLELIRLYSHQPEKLSHDVIFLFNGAEESSLLASHGFITQHPWRHSIRAFINLEASGSGGRELLFQAGPANPWLLNSYLEASIHPHCSVIGQEVFQSGVYPGDTDYRVFRDYGRVPGLDLAFVQNGYWWHTEFDEAERITPGSLQRAGENVYSTLNHLLASPYLENPAEFADTKSVFFDFLGLFVVVYPLKIAHLVSILFIVTSFVITIANGLKNGSGLYVAARNYVLTIISMVGFTYVMIKLAPLWLGIMSWYTYHWMAVIIYGLPAFWLGCTTLTFLTNSLTDKQKMDHSVAIENVHLCLISLILAVFTYFDIASGFLFALMGLPILRKLIPMKNLGIWSTIAIHLLFAFPGISMSIYTSEMMLSIFIPIMGRTSGNPEPVVASFVAFGTISTVLALIPLLSRSESVRDKNECGLRNYIYMMLGVLMIILTILYVMASFVKSPYNWNEKYPTTKRTQFFHSNRHFRNEDGTVLLNDTVIYAISHDFRGAEDIPFVNAENDFMGLDCRYNDPYCEIPFYYPTRHRIQDRHIRFKYAAERPHFSKPSELRVIKKTNDGDRKIHFEMEIKGGGQISAYLIGQHSWQISNCSMMSEPMTAPEDHMFLFLTCSGHECATWKFDVTMESSTPLVRGESPLLVGVASHYLHGPDMQSGILKEYLNTIEERRKLSNQWAITASMWNVDLIYRFP